MTRRRAQSARRSTTARSSSSAPLQGPASRSAASWRARRPYAAYALGQLDPLLFGRRSGGCRASAHNQALVLHSHGGLGNATFAMGEAGALDALLQPAPGRAPHVPDVRGEPPRYGPAVLRAGPAPDDDPHAGDAQTPSAPVEGADVRRLRGAGCARRSTALYRTDGVPSYYSSRQIDDSVYFGAERDGALDRRRRHARDLQRERDRRRRQRVHAPGLPRAAPGAGDDGRRDGAAAALLPRGGAERRSDERRRPCARTSGWATAKWRA